MRRTTRTATALAATAIAAAAPAAVAARAAVAAALQAVAHVATFTTSRLDDHAYGWARLPEAQNLDGDTGVGVHSSSSGASGASGAENSGIASSA